MNYPNIGFGLGLRSPHYDEILATRPKQVDWFEIISENFIDAHQGYWEFLADLRKDYLIVMHGVSLSIGSPDPLNKEYLNKLANLANFLQVPWLSDHLCWTGMNGKNTHDLLPLPYSEEMLAHVVSKIHQVQETLGRNIVIENPSSYVEFNASEMPEAEFLVRLVKATDCGILLDVNNVFVSSFNHGFDAKEYIDALPTANIAQIHLAGHKNFGTHIIDTHDNFVLDEVWQLYDYTIKTKGQISTMIEWDENIPTFSMLVAELEKAKILSSARLAA